MDRLPLMVQKMAGTSMQHNRTARGDSYSVSSDFIRLLGIHSVQRLKQEFVSLVISRNRRGNCFTARAGFVFKLPRNGLGYGRPPEELTSLKNKTAPVKDLILSRTRIAALGYHTGKKSLIVDLRQPSEPGGLREALRRFVESWGVGGEPMSYGAPIAGSPFGLLHRVAWSPSQTAPR